MNTDIYDVCVIGSGPAGCTAVIYSSRANLKTLQLEGNFVGGQLTTTHIVENYPGFPSGIDGFDLVQNFRMHAKKFGAYIKSEEAHTIKPEEHYFVIQTKRNTYKALVIIMATGSKACHLIFPGSVLYWNKGISACAVCDGSLPRFKDKPVAVVGGGDTAMEEAMYLSKHASVVYIIHRKNKFRASQILQNRVFQTKNIQVIWNSQIFSAHGTEEEGLTSLELVDVDMVKKAITVSGLFYAVGSEPQSHIVKHLVQTNNDYIVTGLYKNWPTMTSRPGIFACGDVQDNKYRQAITASASGCMAALDVDRYLAENMYNQG